MSRSIPGKMRARASVTKLETNEKNFEILKSKLGPIVFKIVIEQKKIIDIFHLLKKYFLLLPSNSTLEIGNALIDTALVNSSGKDRFNALKTQNKGQTSFREFVGFMVSEYTIEQKSNESEQSGESIQTSDSLQINEELHAQLAPLAFRIAARTDEMTRCFSLFQEMFAVFDEGKSGVIERSEMNKLVEAGIISSRTLKKLDQEPGSETQLDFNQFLGLWLDKFIEDDQEQDSVLKSKLGPIVFKIALSQENIRAGFTLLQNIYNVFDVDHSGSVKKDAFVAFGFVSPDLVKNFRTTIEGHLSFIEFGALYASAFANGEFESTNTEEKKSTDISLELAQKIAPYMMRLSARTEEFNRIFGLFKALFDVFDEDNDGKMNKKELNKLKEADFLNQTEIDQWKDGALEFSDFMAFWVTHYLDEVTQQEEKEKGKEFTQQEKQLFPRLFRISCQKENTTKVFQLLKEIFDILDEDKSGFIPKADVLEMVKNGFLSGAGLPTLASFNCQRENYLSFGEFLLWIADSQTI